MGWAGAVFKTIGFIKPEETSPRFDAIRKEGTPFIGFKNLEQISDHSLEENLSDLRRLKEDFPNKIIVASIMGETDGEWTSLAKLVTDAGADIIECNFSCPQMVGEGLGSDVGQNPDLVRHYTECVKKGTSLPVLAKMTPNIGNMEIPAIAAVKGGVDGIAAINTIKCITGFDLENIPQDVIDYCNEENFPLFTLPWSVYIIDITYDFCRRIIEKEKIETTAAEAFKNIILTPEQGEKYYPFLERHGFSKAVGYRIFTLNFRKDGKNITEDFERSNHIKLWSILAKSKDYPSAMFVLENTIVVIRQDADRKFIKNLTDTLDAVSEHKNLQQVRRCRSRRYYKIFSVTRGYSPKV